MSGPHLRDEPRFVLSLQEADHEGQGPCPLEVIQIPSFSSIFGKLFPDLPQVLASKEFLNQVVRESYAPFLVDVDHIMF